MHKNYKHLTYSFKTHTNRCNTVAGTYALKEMHVKAGEQLMLGREENQVKLPGSTVGIDEYKGRRMSAAARDSR